MKPTTTTTIQKALPPPSQEQRHIIRECDPGNKEHKIKLVAAYAGTGKTTLLRMIGSQYPDKKFLYMTFTKITPATIESFPKNVKCLTYDSFLFRHFRESRMPHNVQRSWFCRYPFSIGNPQADADMEEFNQFLISPDKTPEQLSKKTLRELWTMMRDREEPFYNKITNYPFVRKLMLENCRSGVTTKFEPRPNVKQRKKLPKALALKQLGFEIDEEDVDKESSSSNTDDNNNDNDDSSDDNSDDDDDNVDNNVDKDGVASIFKIPTTQNLDKLETIRTTFDEIMIDECQDLDRVMFQTLGFVNCIKLFVGDPYQAIFTFEPSNMNVFDFYPNLPRFALTETYRYSDRIASLAGAVIGLTPQDRSIVSKKVHKSVELDIVNENTLPLSVDLSQASSSSSSSDDDDDDHKDDDDESETSDDNKVSIVSSSMVSIPTEQQQQPPQKSFLTTGIEDLKYLPRMYKNIKQIAIIARLNETLLKIILQDNIIVHRDVFLYGIDDLIHLIDTKDESEKKAYMTSLCGMYGAYNIKNKLIGIKNNGKTAKTATFILTSCHRAKGLEFDAVFICSDFAINKMVQRKPPKGASYQKMLELEARSKKEAFEQKKIIYVGITRVINYLFIPSIVQRRLLHSGDSFLLFFHCCLK